MRVTSLDSILQTTKLRLSLLCIQKLGMPYIMTCKRQKHPQMAAGLIFKTTPVPHASCTPLLRMARGDALRAPHRQPMAFQGKARGPRRTGGSTWTYTRRGRGGAFREGEGGSPEWTPGLASGTTRACFACQRPRRGAAARASPARPGRAGASAHQTARWMGGDCQQLPALARTPPAPSGG